MNSKVSIVVPVYNAEKYIEDCVYTLSNQTYKNIEIILIDDGSSDRSGEICDALSKVDNRIVVIHQVNKGVSAARNAGISVASGYWIMFVDSDDWLELDALSSILKYENLGIDILSFSLVKTTDYSFRDTSTVKCFDIKEYKEYLLGACLIDTERFCGLFPKDMRFGPKMVYPVVKLYKSDILKLNCIYFPERIRLGEDQLFNINVLNVANGVLFLDKALYHYRIHDESACNNINKLVDSYSDYVYALDDIKEMSVEFNRYKMYRKYDILKSLIVVMASNSKGLVSNVILCKELRKYVKKTNSDSSIKSIELKNFESKKDKFILILLKAKLYFIAIIIYQVFFKFKRRIEK